MMMGATLSPGEGELFRFQVPGSGVPCLVRYDDNQMQEATYLHDAGTGSWFSPMSRNWCDGADTATVSSVRIVPGPMGMSDWVVVANMLEPFASMDVDFGADEDVRFGGAGVDLAGTDWDVWGQDSYLDAMDQTSYGASAGGYTIGSSVLASGEDHEMFIVFSDSVNDKPCIVAGASMVHDADQSGQIPFVSDDFCHTGRSASEFVGDQDPGAGYGPNRLWLAYDEMSSMWSVNGTWDARFNYASASVGSGSSMESMGQVLEDAYMSFYVDDMGIRTMYANDMGTAVEAGEGTLFTFEWTGAGVPCFMSPNWAGSTYYYESGSDPEYIDWQSPDWCEGPDEALTSLKVVAGPMNMGDWMVVANTNQAFTDVQVRLTGDYSGWGGEGPAVIAQGWTAYETDTSVFRADWMGGMLDALPAGEDHHLFYGWYGEKPCIERGDDTYILDDMYTSMDIVSDDFCGGSSGGAGNPSDYIGAMDPGDGYGPNRMWLSYDDMSGEWSVNGKWDRSLITVATMVVGSQMAYPGIGLAPVEMVWNFDHTTDPMMGEGFMTSNNGETGTTLTAGEGELFRFMYGSGVPCLVGYYDDWAMDATYFQDEMWMQLEVQSPDFCE
jgi:hypothetical protein